MSFLSIATASAAYGTLGRSGCSQLHPTECDSSVLVSRSQVQSCTREAALDLLPVLRVQSRGPVRLASTGSTRRPRSYGVLLVLAHLRCRSCFSIQPSSAPQPSSSASNRSTLLGSRSPRSRSLRQPCTETLRASSIPRV